MYPKGILPKLLIWFPRNGLLNIFPFCHFCSTRDHLKHHNFGVFHFLKNRFHHFKAQRISFHLVYLMTSFDDTDNYPCLLIFDL